MSVNKSERRARLGELKAERRTMLFHEAPHKLKATLKDFCQAFGGERRIAICRELTKLNEEVLRTTLSQAVEYYEATEPRGEYVLVLAGASVTDAKTGAFWQEMEIPQHVAHYMGQGMSKMDAIKQTAKDRGLPKNEVYKKVL